MQMRGKGTAKEDSKGESEADKAHNLQDICCWRLPTAEGIVWSNCSCPMTRMKKCVLAKLLRKNMIGKETILKLSETDKA